MARQPWMLTKYGQRRPRLTSWWRIVWNTDLRAASFVCDEIVKRRDVPPRLLARLGVTLKGERWLR